MATGSSSTRTRLLVGRGVARLLLRLFLFGVHQEIGLDERIEVSVEHRVGVLVGDEQRAAPAVGDVDRLLASLDQVAELAGVWPSSRSRIRQGLAVLP